MRNYQGPRQALVQIEDAQLIEQDGDRTLEVSASVVKDGKALQGVNLTIYVNRKAFAPTATDETGRCFWSLDKLHGRELIREGHGQILIEVAYPDAEGFVAKAVRTIALKKGDSTKVGEPKKKEEKKKRLVINVPETALRSRNNTYTLPAIRTLNKDGKPGAEDLIFTSTVPVTLKDKSTRKALIHNGKRANNTGHFEYQTPSTGLVLLEVSFNGTQPCELTVLHVESGETASLTMDFDY